jgi:hypothetical protein
LRRREVNPEAREVTLQDRLFEICEELSGVTLS